MPLSRSHITHETSHITHHTSHITKSHITHHTSHITHHTSHITHHTSNITDLDRSIPGQHASCCCGVSRTNQNISQFKTRHDKGDEISKMITCSKKTCSPAVAKISNRHAVRKSSLALLRSRQKQMQMGWVILSPLK